MNRTVILFAVILGILSSLNTAAQRFMPLPKFYRPIDSAAIAENQQKLEKGQTDFGMTVGTGFSTGNYGSMMNSYIAPNVQYQATEDLQLNFSGIFSTGKGSLQPGGPSFSSGQLNPQSYGISGQGIYTPTNKLTVSFSGTVMENSSIQPFNLYPSQNTNMNYKSMSLGVGYQFSEKTSISFQFRMSDGGNMFYSPYNNYNQMYSPFNPYHQRTYPW